MKRCIIASLLIAALLMSVCPAAALADSPDEPGKPWRPLEPFQESNDAMGENAELGLITPYGHDEYDNFGRILYIGRIEAYYPE